MVKALRVSSSESYELSFVIEHVRDVRDPEHPLSLEALGVVNLSDIEVEDPVVRNGSTRNYSRVTVWFTPTIPQCSMSTLIGLTLMVKLARSLPRRFKIQVKVKPGTHVDEISMNEQVNDKERVSAALENPAMLKLVNDCLAPLPEQ